MPQHHARIALALTLLLVPIPSCASHPLQDVFEDLSWRAPTVLQTRHTALHSPYDSRLTGAFGNVIDREFEFVAALYGMDAADRVEMRLIPIATQQEGEDPGDNLLRSMNVSSNHYGAYTVSGDRECIVVYVPAEARAAGVGMISKVPTIRHELSHLMCRRLSRSRLPRWLDEGIAEFVERASPDPVHLMTPEGFVPIEVLDSTSEASRHALDDAMTWGTGVHDRQTDPATVSLRYALSRAFVLFLLRREAGTFRARFDRITSRSPAELQALGDEWLRWMHALDPVATIDRLLESPDAGDRKRVMSRIHNLSGDPRYQTLQTGRYLAFAAQQLDDAETFPPASLYFLFRVGRKMNRSFLEELARAPSPMKRLLGLAMTRWQGVAVDQELVRRTTAELSAAQRQQCTAVLSVLRI